MDKNFTNQDLRERSFRGQHLEGALFRFADLRGVDFTGAHLSGADLSGARTGMARDWAIVVAMLALIASLLLGTVAGLGGGWLRALIDSPEPRLRVLGIFFTVEMALFLLAFVYKGLSFAARRVLPAAIGLAAMIALVAIILGAGTGRGALAVLAFSALLMAIVCLATLARASAGSVNMIIFAIVAVSGALVGGLQGGGLYATAIALATMLAGRRTLSGRADPGIASLVTSIACAGGTRFRNADLSSTTFDGAELRNADFRGALLQSASFQTAHIRLCAFDRDAYVTSQGGNKP